MSIAPNLFHIFVVAIFLAFLTANLKDEAATLKNISYTVMTAMVSYHSYLIYKKLNTTK